MASFLKPMMEYLPDKRKTALEMLEHPWLTAGNANGGPDLVPGSSGDR